MYTQGARPPGGQLELGRHPAAAWEARAFIDQELAPHLPAAAAFDLRLIATELVTNAVVHGRGRITLKARIVGDVLRVEVVDEGTGQADRVRAQAPSDEATGGRGLQIVEALSRRWGAYEGTTTVWADVPIR